MCRPARQSSLVHWMVRLHLPDRCRYFGAGSCCPTCRSACDGYLPGSCRRLVGNRNPDLKDSVIVGGPDVVLVDRTGEGYRAGKGAVPEFRTVSPLILVLGFFLVADLTSLGTARSPGSQRQPGPGTGFPAPIKYVRAALMLRVFSPCCWRERYNRWLCGGCVFRDSVDVLPVRLRWLSVAVRCLRPHRFPVHPGFPCP